MTEEHTLRLTAQAQVSSNARFLSSDPPPYNSLVFPAHTTMRSQGLGHGREGNNRGPSGGLRCFVAPVRGPALTTRTNPSIRPRFFAAHPETVVIVDMDRLLPVLDNIHDRLTRVETRVRESCDQSAGLIIANHRRGLPLVHFVLYWFIQATSVQAVERFLDGIVCLTVIMLLVIWVVPQTAWLVRALMA